MQALCSYEDLVRLRVCMKDASQSMKCECMETHNLVCTGVNNAEHHFLMHMHLLVYYHVYYACTLKYTSMH